jgi:hypothetical protein
MAVEFVLLFRGKVEGVESIVDTGGVESARLRLERSES